MRRDPRSPFRDDADALRERVDALGRELDEVRRQKAALQDVGAREAALAAELAALKSRATTAARQGSPTLDGMRVASPCKADWDKMVGDDQVRFCGGCQKNVYDVSAMTRAAAERLIAEKEGKLCVRFAQRADGTVVTEDCPVGAKAVRRRRLALVGVGIGVTAVAAAASAAFVRSVTVMGKMAPDEPLAHPADGVTITMGDSAEPPAPSSSLTREKCDPQPGSSAAPSAQPSVPPHATPRMGKPSFVPPAATDAPRAPKK